MTDGWLQLRWRVEGAGNVVLPPLAGNHRRDELWRTTCFELFIRNGPGEGYAELNFSPSENWAAYDFSAPRKDMAERAVSRDPVITPRLGGNILIVDVALRLADLPHLPAAFAMTAVIEEAGSATSYWAMHHGSERPDFHDPACFIGRLAAPEAA